MRKSSFIFAKLNKLWLVSILWVAAGVLFSYRMMGYDYTPGKLGMRLESWPADTALARSSETKTIVAFLHPRCVCSRATVTQLLRILERHAGADLLVPVFAPSKGAEAEKWRDGEYARTIRAHVPEARIVSDLDGAEARRFGAFTSGTLLVYDPKGREIFRGGITDRRGGDSYDNIGRRNLARALSQSGVTVAKASPVFGCPLIRETGIEAGEGSDVLGAR